jgi:hypothetical protein
MGLDFGHGNQEIRFQHVRDSTARLQRAARERADEEARRIPWQRLYEVRNQYIDWQEFNFWARSILEVEQRIVDWLAEILQNRCPGFLETEKALTPKAAKTRPLVLRLEDWIEDHVFGLAKQEGYFFAISYYAIRDPRYQRAEVCWSECVDRWSKLRPVRYPSFEEWTALAEKCDETAHLVPRERKARASAKLADPGRLSEAAARYIDYEALAYWARPALEGGSTGRLNARKSSTAGLHLIGWTSARRCACGRAGTEMPKVWVSGYLPSALACSDHQRMLSSARDVPAVRGGL